MVLMHSSQCQATCIRDVAVYLIARTRKWREMEVEVAPLRRCPARQAAEGDLCHAKRSPDHLHEAGVLDSASEEQLTGLEFCQRYFLFVGLCTHASDRRTSRRVSLFCGKKK